MRFTQKYDYSHKNINYSGFYFIMFDWLIDSLIWLIDLLIDNDLLNYIHCYLDMFFVYIGLCNSIQFVFYYMLYAYFEVFYILCFNYISFIFQVIKPLFSFFYFMHINTRIPSEKYLFFCKYLCDTVLSMRYFIILPDNRHYHENMVCITTLM